MLTLAVGSSLLALWIAVRFPRLSPQSAPGIAAAVFALVLVVGVGPRAVELVGPPLGAFAAIFLIALPCCVYLFLAAAWVILWAGRALRPHL